MREFDGKVAVVTGAASGLGLAFAERFAREGMKVVLADVEEPALDGAVGNLQRQERDVIGVVADVRNPEQVDAIAETAIAEYGTVHLVCSNAGVSSGGAEDIASTPLQDWEWVLAVNFWGVLHGIRTFLPILERQGEGGHIVNTASAAGIITARGAASAPYDVSKHAVVALSEAVYLELRAKESDVGVSVLCPAFVTSRLGDSARNRPAEFGSSPPAQERRPARASAVADSLTTPERIADILVDGIRDERFYILTHPGTDQMVRARMQALVDGRHPEPPDITVLRRPE